VSTASSPNAFPLERPLIRRRRSRREPVVRSEGLPYFLCGDENRVAAFLATADATTLAIGNPILLVGPVGSGKTAIAMHLAARAAVLGDTSEQQDSPLETVYLPAIDFSRDYAEAIEVDDLQPLQQRLTIAGVLIIDDLQQIADKIASQEELARRIEERVESGRPTILTCRRMPGEVRGLKSALVSRMLPGMTVSLQYPQGKTRINLIAEFAIFHGLDLDPSLIEILDQGLAGNVPARSLQAAVRHVELECRMRNSSPGIDEIQAAINATDSRKELAMTDIARAVARHYQIKMSELKSPSRLKTIVKARSLAMWLSRSLTGKSMHQIGDFFGGRDHTTVMHAIRKIDAIIGDDTDLQRAADEIQEQLSS
jgi:chromosomal replication initiator protein